MIRSYLFPLLIIIGEIRLYLAYRQGASEGKLLFLLKLMVGLLAIIVWLCWLLVFGELPKGL
jgi:hypothetical protein